MDKKYRRRKVHLAFWILVDTWRLMYDNRYALLSPVGDLSFGSSPIVPHLGLSQFNTSNPYDLLPLSTTCLRIEEYTSHQD